MTAELTSEQREVIWPVCVYVCVCNRDRANEKKSEKRAVHLRIVYLSACQEVRCVRQYVWESD